MAWHAKPRWDRTRQRWRVQLRGRQYILGNDEAEAYRRFSVLLRDLGIGASAAPPQTVAGVCRRWLIDHRKEVNQYHVSKWVDYIGLEMVIVDLPADVFYGFRKYLEDTGYSANTVKDTMQAIWRCLRWALDRELIAKLPRAPKYPKIKRQPRDIPPAKLREILRGLRSPTLRKRRLRPLAVFILATGCRPAEARLATWEEFDIADATWRLPGHRTKTREARTIFLSRYALAALRVARNLGGTGIVFKSMQGRPFSKKGFCEGLKRLGATPYQLRHSFGQQALAQTDIAVVAALLGHTNLATVKTYAQIRDNRMRAEMAALNMRPPRAPRVRLPVGTPAPSSRKVSQRSPRKSDTARRRKTS